MDKQEPVAYVHLKEWLDGTLWPEDAFSQNPHEEMAPLYTAPPKRDSSSWVDLTQDEMIECHWEGDFRKTYENISAKLREKNHK